MTNIYYPGTGLLNTVTGTPSGGSAVEYAKCTKYAPTGKIGKITHAYNNTKTEYTYDAKTTRLTTLKTSGPAPENVTIQSKSYTYYEAGDIHTITDKLVTPNIIYTYQYDNLHRLTEETTSDNTLPTDADIMTYTYGDSEHINAVTSINYNGSDYGFSYDANGNVKSGYDFTNPASIAARSLTWNADNMPVTVTRGSVTTSLTYDGDGVRAKKIEVGATTSTTFYISNDYEIKNGTPIKYIFAGNLRVAEIEGPTSTIFHKDHLGSSTAMTNNIGINIESTEYLPFGGMRSHTGLDISDFKFIDQEVDISSNLYNYDARLYDPVIGRFISVDTVVPDWFDPQALNRFSYCRNNPLIYTDPSGHEWQWWENFKKYWGDVGKKYINGEYEWTNPKPPDNWNDLNEEQQIDWIRNEYTKKVKEPYTAAIGTAVTLGELGEAAVLTKAAKSAVETGLKSGEKFVLEGLTKTSSRQLVSKLGLPKAQENAVLSAVTRATSSSQIKVTQNGSEVIVQIFREGKNGFQVIESKISISGSKTVIQKGYDAAGKIEHYHPK